MGSRSGLLHSCARPRASHLASLRRQQKRPSTLPDVTVAWGTGVRPGQGAVSSSQSPEAQESLQGHLSSQTRPVPAAWHSGPLTAPHPGPRPQAPVTAPCEGSQEEELEVSPQIPCLGAAHQLQASAFFPLGLNCRKKMTCLGPRTLIQEGLRGWCSLLPRLSQGILSF